MVMVSSIGPMLLALATAAGYGMPVTPAMVSTRTTSAASTTGEVGAHSASALTSEIVREIRRSEEGLVAAIRNNASDFELEKMTKVLKFR